MGVHSNKQLKAFYRERLVEIQASAEPRCRHFGECGGCALQQLSYADQLELKLAAARQIFSSKTFADIVPEMAITGSPQEYGYRLKMDYVLAAEPFHEPHTRMGLRKRSQFRHVIDLQECHLIPPEWFKKLRQVYAHGVELGLANYDLVAHTGEVRYFVVRTAGERAMLNIVTKTTAETEKISQLADFALELGFTTINWLHQPEVSDVSFGELIKTFGHEQLQVEVGDYKFLIGANSFFQNNAAAFNLLIDFVKQHAEPAANLYDLYSGVGTIGIMLADRFQQVTAVEISEDNHELAAKNAELNGVTNHIAYLGDVAEFLSSVPRIESVVVDPPRVGILGAGVSSLMSAKPEQIIYISCNPVTQAQDLELLLSGGEYNLEHLQLFDLYPQTLHSESVAILSRS